MSSPDEVFDVIAVDADSALQEASTSRNYNLSELFVLSSEPLSRMPWQPKRFRFSIARRAPTIESRDGYWSVDSAHDSGFGEGSQDVPLTGTPLGLITEQEIGGHLVGRDDDEIRGRLVGGEGQLRHDIGRPRRLVKNPFDDDRINDRAGPVRNVGQDLIKVDGLPLL